MKSGPRRLTNTSKRTTTRKPAKWDGIEGSKTDPLMILQKKMKKAGFTHLQLTTEGPQFSLFVGGRLVLNLNLKERRDGTFHVKPELPLWITREIEAAGYETKPRKPAAPHGPALRLVGGH